jgi:hypothetical protein
MPGWWLGGLAVAADAHVAGGDAAHGALVVVEHFGAGEAGIDLDAERFGLRAEPAAELAQADDVVAVVLQSSRAAASPAGRRSRAG